MSKLRWVMLQVLSLVAFAQVVSASDGSVSDASVPAVNSGSPLVSAAPSINIEQFASIQVAPSAPVSLAPTAPVGEIPSVNGQVEQGVSAVTVGFTHGWSLPLILILLSSITYIVTAVLKAKKVLTSAKGILFCTVAAGLLFGVGSVMFTGVSLPSALIFTLAGPGAIPIHKILKTYLSIDLGKQSDA